MRLVVVGHAGHGKDTVCEILEREHGLTFGASSRMALGTVVWPVLTKREVREEFLKEYPGRRDEAEQMGAKYASRQACYEGRDEHRGAWYDMITWLNTPDRARLGEAIFSQFDVYCGLRSQTELEAVRRQIPEVAVVWVDAGKRVKGESTESCTVTREMADGFIDNNGPLGTLAAKVARMLEGIGQGNKGG